MQDTRSLCIYFVFSIYCYSFVVCAIAQYYRYKVRRCYQTVYEVVMWSETVGLRTRPV